MLKEYRMDLEEVQSNFKLINKVLSCIFKTVTLSV